MSRVYKRGELKMGGGGGGGGFSLRDLSALEEKARDALREGNTGKRNIFLSFAYEDVNEVNLLRAQAKNEKSDLEFNDWSVQEPFDSERAPYIQQRIGERIGQASVVVVYLSTDSARSKWVNWEVEEGLRRGKAILGVYKGDAAPVEQPSAIKQNRIKVVPWAQLADTIKTIK